MASSVSRSILLRDRSFWIPLLIAVASLAFLRLSAYRASGFAAGFVGKLEGLSVDLRHDLRLRAGRATTPTRSLVCIEIDDGSLRELGMLPWPRARHADVIRRLFQAGVRAVVFDVYFRNSQTESDDRAFVAACREAGPVAVGLPVLLREDGAPPDEAIAGLQPFWLKTPIPADRRPPCVSQAYAPFPGLSEVLRAAGHIAGVPDLDGTFRQYPLLVSTGKRLIPSLGVVLACLMLDVDPRQISIEPGVMVVPAASGPIRVPVDRHLKSWLEFPGTFARSFDRVSYRRIVTLQQNDALAGQLRGRVAFITYAYTGADQGRTPLEPTVPRSVIHTATANAILQRSFLRHAGSLPTVLIEILFAVGLPLAAVLFGPVTFIAFGLLLVLAWFATATSVFVRYGLILDVAEPVILGLVVVFAALQTKLLAEARRRGEVEHTLGRYFSPQVVRRILASPGGFSLQTQRKELTMLFSDIRGFTTLSEMLDPDEVRLLLRGYFDRMTEIVFRHGGTVDKFIGDGMLAFFGDPEPCDDHAFEAVLAAIEMQREVRLFSTDRVNAGLEPIKIRIGVNTGLVAVGDMGGSRRVEYSVIGRSVNHAQRLESAAPPGGILIGSRTLELVGARVSIRSSRFVQLKGIDEPVQVHEIDLGETSTNERV